MAKPPAQSPSETELEELARKHITFEVLALIDAMGRGKAGAVPGPRELAIGVDSHALSSHDMLLHARLLANFMECDASCRKGLHKHDIEARHYVPEWPGVDALGSDSDRVDKALAHLSRDRLGIGKIPLDQRPAIALRVLKALSKFIEELPPEQRPWFEQAATAIKGALS